MTLEEVIETQSEIIDCQNKLIMKLATDLNIELAYSEEITRITKLKKELEV